MLCMKKTDVLKRFEEQGKPAPQWVLNAPADAVFAQGFNGRGHVPLHIVGEKRPEAQRGLVSIEIG